MGLVPYNQGTCIALFPYGYWFRGLHRSVRTSYRQIQLLSPPSWTFSAALFLPVQKFHVRHTSLLPPPLSNFVINALMIIEKYRFASSSDNWKKALRSAVLILNPNLLIFYFPPPKNSSLMSTSFCVLWKNSPPAMTCAGVRLH